MQLEDASRCANVTAQTMAYGEGNGGAGAVAGARLLPVSCCVQVENEALVKQNGKWQTETSSNISSSK